MRAIAISVAAMAATLMAPAMAQDRALSDREVEFYSEMLALGDVCQTVAFAVRRDALADYVAARLTGSTEQDVDEVLGLRDAKLASLHEESTDLEEMPRNYRRERRTNDYFADLVMRCIRMAENSRSSPFFTQRQTVTASN